MKEYFLDGAEIIDAYRVVPRTVLFFYGMMLAQVTHWFIKLGAPTAEQLGAFTTVWGASAAIFNFYAKTGRAWGPQLEWDETKLAQYFKEKKRKENE